MVTGHTAVFERTLRTSAIWLDELARELDCIAASRPGGAGSRAAAPAARVVAKDEKKAYVALRATLHALRDRLPLPEVIQLGAQLPLLLRGAFYDGWRPTGKPLKIRRREQFLALVREHMGNGAAISPERAVRGVFRLLSARVSAGEIDDVIDSLPRDIADLWFEDSRYTERDD